MKIGLLQYNIKWEDKESNKTKIREILERSDDNAQVDWIIFSEMTLSGFTMNRKIAELSDLDKNFFSQLARDYNVNISFGGVEDGYNKLITLNRKGERINEYSKIHLYSFGKENEYYKSGNKQSAFELEGLKIMPAICFDLRFSYFFWDMAEKVDAYIVIAAWPKSRAQHWMTLLRARAIENQAYCFGVNRIGTEGKIEYSGNSMAFNSLGEVLIDAGNDEGLFVNTADIRADLTAEIRQKFPFLKERKK